ncbi:SUKH-4 family immunity protein [Kitasatospora sp. NPDC127059]|uniref:SUKH-4 family immunity protein n=1 Tax=unclassified Kitasatospora TaxID=2633591 RepID=UPI0036529547
MAGAGTGDRRVREFPAAGESSWERAYLDLGAAGEEPLRSVEGFQLLGEACYEAWEGPVAVLLDGGSGEVFLGRPGDDGVLRRDLLASSPACLVALARVMETLGGGPEYGPAAVAEVERVGRERLRAADPELYRRTGGRPAHWETALTIRALARGARAGGAEGLAYVVTPELVEDLATLEGGGGGVRRFAEAELPAGVSHGPSRRLLTEVGLPLSGGCLLSVEAEGPLRTLAEDSPENFDPENEEELSTRAYQGGFLVVGEWMYDLDVVLDGATGRVELPDFWDDGDPAAYLHRDLSALLYTLWTFHRLRVAREAAYRLRREAPWSVFDPCELFDGAAEEAMRALDAEAFASEKHFWPMRIDDGHMGSLLE